MSAAPGDALHSWVQAARGVAAKLSALGAAADVVRTAPAEVAGATGLRRVLISRLGDGALVAESVAVDGDSAEDLRAALSEPIALGYPLVEAEIIRRRRATLVELDTPDRAAHAATLGWRTYLVAPVLTDGHVTGLIHADGTRDGAPLTELDAAQLGALADVFGLVVERAVLRRRLRGQQDAVRQVAAWADARISELSDGAIDLAAAGADDAAPQSAVNGAAFDDLLTKREVEVLELMAKGETNGAIARTLVLAEGTVKFHVKNILRKLQASNRAEATSRYLQMTVRARAGPAGRASRLRSR